MLGGSELKGGCSVPVCVLDFHDWQ